MKIGPSTPGVAGDATAQAAAASPARAAGNAAAGTAAAAQPAAAAESSAKVELSSTASLLSASGAGADFDAEKVQRISQAIADGTFKVDAGAIADRLIANAEEVLRGGRPAAAG